MTEPDDKTFEYVLGTLSEEERAAFKQSLEQNSDLERDLNFWEGHLNALNDPSDTLAPKPGTWKAIESAIAPVARAEVNGRPRWLSWLPWALTAAMTMVLTLLISLGQFPSQDPSAVPVDYVAVLTDETGQAKLTALTEGENQNMWLQWEDIPIGQDQDLQIWAKSKTDNEIRSVAVVDDQSTKRVQLMDAHWRLIKDAESLILTIEEKGGSALDEPSEIVIATGVCVRLNRKEKTT